MTGCSTKNRHRGYYSWAARLDTVIVWSRYSFDDLGAV